MRIERRTFLKTALAGCACCAVRGVDRVMAGAHWSYDGATGPEHWGELAPEFKVCQLGGQQTPINLVHATHGAAEAPGFAYRAFPLSLVNNGHTVQANAAPGSFLTLDGVRYELKQFHLHHPSEHRVDGRAFDMELHLVHASAEGALAVVGVFIAAGAHNPVLEPVLGHLPASEGGTAEAGVSFDPAGVLPASRESFRYTGSLTTPPCSEGLAWTVFREPVTASPAQIAAFAALFPNNARPIQKINDRLLIQTSGP